MTAKLCVPSAVLTCAPTGTSAEDAARTGANVTAPVAATPGRRVKPKSAPNVSQIGAVLVASRVRARSSTISHCSHRATLAAPSSSARMTLPGVKSSSAGLFACTAAAMPCTSAV